MHCIAQFRLKKIALFKMVADVATLRCQTSSLNKFDALTADEWGGGSAPRCRDSDK
jgi:hypothetical protein